MSDFNRRLQRLEALVIVEPLQILQAIAEGDRFAVEIDGVLYRSNEGEEPETFAARLSSSAAVIATPDDARL